MLTKNCVKQCDFHWLSIINRIFNKNDYLGCLKHFGFISSYSLASSSMFYTHDPPNGTNIVPVLEEHSIFL